MRKVLTIICLEVAAICGSTVVAMMWPTIDASTGTAVLLGCGALGLLGIAIWVWPASWLPAPRRTKARGWMTPFEVVSYMANRSQWGADTQAIYDRAGDGMTAILGTFFEFRQRAKEPDTLIRAHGLKDGEGPSVPIPHTFWLDNSFDVMPTLELARKTAPYPQRGDVQHRVGSKPVIYTGVMVESAGVLKTWPPIGRLGRAKLRVAEYLRRRKAAADARS